MLSLSIKVCVNSLGAPGQINGELAAQEVVTFSHNTQRWEHHGGMEGEREREGRGSERGRKKREKRLMVSRQESVCVHLPVSLGI